MVKVLLGFTFSLLTVTSLASDSCRIETYSKIYKVNNNEVPNTFSLIKKSNCNQKQKQAFLKFILNSDGTVTSNKAKRFISELYKQNVSITPNKISLYDLNKTLKEKFNSNSNWFWNEIKLTSRKDFLLLNENETLSFQCTNCEYSGAKNVKAVISNPLTNQYKYEWLNGSIVIKTKALVAVKNLAVSNLALTKDLFVEKLVLMKSPENLFTNTKALHFYKINKPIKDGSALSFRDLTPVSLVQAGRPTKVILKNDSLSLSSVANALRNGHFGDLIQLRNTKTNKIIMGKVVDFNKVVVDL